MTDNIKSEDTVPMKVYFEKLLEGVQHLLESKDRELKEYIDVRLSSMDKATELAYNQLSAKLLSMNELREQLNNQATTLASKEAVDNLAIQVALCITNDKFDATINAILTDVRLLRESKATLEGKASQASVTLTLIIAISGVLLSTIGLAITIAKYFA